MRQLDVQGTSYTVNITMDDATVTELSDAGFTLYAFKAVSSSMGGGAPTVWASTNTYSAATTLAWTEDYYAYASNSSISSGVTFIGSDTKEISLGQTLQVNRNAVTSVVGVGNPGTITVQNMTTTQFSCGLAQPSPIGGQPTPVCAFPLYGLNRDLITPVEKIALVFAAEPYQQGEVIEGSIGPAVLVDLTQDTTVNTAYNINTGWQTDGITTVNIDPEEFVSTLLGGGDYLPAGINADPITNIVVLKAAANNPLKPVREVARGVPGVPGSQDHQSISCRLNKYGVRQNRQYIILFRDQNTNDRAWEVQCTQVPPTLEGQFRFTKILEIDTAQITS
ncbi:hypothetical protein ACIHCQ_43210 [Streptomyces sp. NPDC052236]|uniref:hypothetical protein n=1 Tax=Streptomyces sp. NPDC052236 TaxID=3365686 RepID=UPI0037D5E0F9